VQISTVNVLASQAESISKYKNIKTKLLQFCANIYCNKQCETCTAFVDSFYNFVLKQNDWPDDDI
jgi:hypothetical protein